MFATQKLPFDFSLKSSKIELEDFKERRKILWQVSGMSQKKQVLA